MLPQGAVFSMAPACLDAEVSLLHKARIITLLAAQMHPDAIAWLSRLSLQVEAPLRPLAEAAWKQATLRAQALSYCLVSSRSAR